MMIRTPHNRDDGGHVIPIHRVCLSGKNAKEDVSGEIQWSPKSGITFRLDFPGVCSTSVIDLLESAKESRGVGRIGERPQQPYLTAETSEGHAVELFSTNATPTATQTTGTSGFSQHTVVDGTALFVRLRISKENDLSLWHETVGDDRLFLRGFCPFHWPEQEKVEFPHRDGVTLTTRCSVTLCEKPLRRMFAAGPASASPTCAWLVFADTPNKLDAPHIPCESERPFFSFLAGKRIPFLWWDHFISNSELERLYFGRQRFTDSDDALYTSQPLPLGETIEAMQFGKTVMGELSELFKRFVKIEGEWPISWIMSPLWVAQRGILDDRLALASVSLERLVDAFRDYRKKHDLNGLKQKFWEPQQGRIVRKALKKELDSVGREVGLSDEQLSILTRRIDNLGQPPNADNLTAVFEYLGINLTTEEKDAINNRNRALHGRRTLEDQEKIENVDDEIQRFDTLRMLIHRALLGLLQYDGPYVDYASRPVSGNFEIKRIERISTEP